MARPLRIEYSGACYHVINCGNQRETVFHEPDHYSIFIDKLGQFSLEYGVKVYCFCCMPNHFHLYLKTQETNFDDLSNQSIIGSDSFVDRIKREFLFAREVNGRAKSDHTSLVHLQSSFTFDEVLNLVCDIYSVDPPDILKRKSVNREARRVLLYCLSRYCRSVMSLTDLAERCSISVSGLTRSRDKVKKLAISDRKLEIQLKDIEKRLKENCKQY